MTKTYEIKFNRSRRTTSNVVFSIRKVKNQKKWTREEDEMLINLAEKYKEKHWKEISKKFAKKNSLQCFSRYKRIRPGIVKGSWKREEDHAIVELVNKYGKSWSKISKMLGTRNGKQIRDRFINVLDPEIKKGKFTEEEDKKLIMLFNQYGSKWATISKYYPNRTADMIKNRFHSSIKKKLGERIDIDSNITNKLLNANDESVNSSLDREADKLNYRSNLSSLIETENISIEISPTLINNTSNEYFETSKNFNTVNSTDMAINSNSSGIHYNTTTNYINEILLFSKEMNAEDPFYSSSNIDFNIEEFFTY